MHIPYGRQLITKEDIRQVVKVLQSDWITQGPKIEEFETALAKYCGAKYAVAVSSGTAALHLACLVAGLKEHDEAITSPITFLATANSILYTQAKSVFADIDYETNNIDPLQIERRITKNTKAILPVHFAGLPCDMVRISGIAKKNNLTVIEDGCHALGARYKANGKWAKVGSCAHSEMTALSFHPVKHITTGEGGAVTANSKKIYEKLKALRNHGIYKDKNSARNKLWYYEMRELGFNYRITDFQCALGLSQIKKIGQFIKRRREIVNMYNESLKDIKAVTVPAAGLEFSSWHLYVLKIDYAYLKLSRQELMERLKKLNIATQVHYIPLYRQPFYRENFKYNPKDYPHAELYYKRALSIPLYPGLSDRQVRRIINSLKKAIGLR